jgi:hypothetical protein
MYAPKRRTLWKKLLSLPGVGELGGGKAGEGVVQI